MNDKELNVSEEVPKYETPKVFVPQPIEPYGHTHAHIKYVADADSDTSPT
ncbi:MAG: hypothetical protein ACP5IT_11380 [Thermoproteota archaeon]|jgi:hypothetical protein